MCARSIRPEGCASVCSLILCAILSLSFAAYAPEEPSLFHDDFEDGSADRWDLAPGWEVHREPDGNRVLKGEGLWQWAILDQSYSWTDYSVEFRLKLGHGGLQLNLRLDDPYGGDRTRYIIGFREDSVYIDKESPPNSYAHLAAQWNTIPLPLGVWHDVEIQAVGGRLRIYVNGWMALEHDDPDPLFDGGIALETLDDPPGSGRGSSSAYVDDVEARRFVRTAFEPEWVRTGGPPGGLGYDIRMRPDNPDVMYVTDARAGVYKSVDGGETWLPSNTGITTRVGLSGDLIPIFSLTIDPHDHDTLWAGTQEARGIYKSIDGGDTWTKMVNGVVEEFGISFRGFTVDPRSSDIVYAAAELASWCDGGEARLGRGFDVTRGVVYKTTDGGRNWRAIWRGENLARYVWIDPRDSDVIYVSTGIFDREAANSNPVRGIPGGEGILKSIDGGATWFPANEGLRNLYVGSLYMHPEDPDILLAGTGNETYMDGNGVYLSTDGGSHWEQVLSEGTQDPADNIISVEFSLSNPSIAYAGSPKNIYRSDDGGRTWHVMTSGDGLWGPSGVVAGRPIDIQVDPRNPDRLFVNNYGGGNFLSTDGGRTWTDASNGYTGATTLDIAVAPDNPWRVLAVPNNGVFESVDGGDEWAGVLYPPPAAKSVVWFAAAISPVNPQHLFAAHSPILQSRDGGHSWEIVQWSSDPWSIGFRVIRFAPSDPRTVYAGTSRPEALHSANVLEERFSASGILVSHDGGTTWSEANDTTSEDAAVTDLAVSSHDSRIVYAATANRGVLRTSDGGRSWAAINRELPPNPLILSVACHPSDSQIVLAGLQHAGVYRSTDGGASWQPSSAGMNPEAIVSDIVFSPMNGRVLFAADRMSGVYRSSDGGITWRAINKGLGVRNVLVLGISSDGRLLYAGTDGGGVYRLDLYGFEKLLERSDRDGDGVPDHEDYCPDWPGDPELNGC